MKILNQEAIRRMISGGTSGAVAVSVGGGGDGGLTPAWVEGNYISKSFFSQLFTIHGTKTVTDPQTGTTTEEEVEITPNQLIDDEYDVTDVEVKFGLWTQQFLSALGKNTSGGGGGGDTLTEPLASINSAGLGAPTAAGQVITWNGSAWIFDIPQGGGGGGSVTSVGLSAPTGFTVNNSPVTSSGTIQLGFATGYSLPTNAKQSNWDAAYSWGNHANAGYLTSSDIQGMATETWVGENYLPLNGGMLTGSLRMGEEEAGSSPYIYWGDGSYVYIGEDADDHMIIRGRYGVNILTDTGYNLQWNNHTLATQTWVNDQGFVKSSGVTSVGMSVPTGLRVNSAASATITGSGTFVLSVQSGYFIPTTSQRTTWNGKQDAIADLATIRSGAALGATAVQPSAITDMATKTWVQQTALSGYATESWVTDNMMKKARLDTTANIDTLYDAGSYRFAETAQGTWPTGVTAGYGQMLVVRGADDTVAQMFFPYRDTQAYLRVGNPMNTNGSWKGWKRLVTPDMNVASATKLATARTLWGQSFDGTANVSGDMSSVGSITMSGSIIMNNTQNIYIKDSGGTLINCVTFNSYNTFALGYGARINNHNTDIQGSYITFATNNGQTSGDHRIEALKIRGGGLLELHYGAMFNNNNAIGFKDSGGTEKTVLRLNNNNQLELGYGLAGSDYPTLIFGGATTGIKFYCGQSNEVASVYRAVDSNQNVRQGIRIGDALLSWDSANNALKVQKYDGTAINMYSLGGVSALGFTAPQSSLDAFHIDYLTSTSVTAQTMQAGRFYLDSTRYIYLDGTTLKYYNGSQSKTIVLS